MKKVIWLLLAAAIAYPVKSTPPAEGMWLPILLGQLTIEDMQANGLKLSAEDIYSVNQSSLKDAVLLFGGGCTGEVISGLGLLLTNHHCGFGQIQSHSSVENDYITNGFWAMNKSEELPCPGLTVTFIIRMEDVSEKSLAGVTDDLSEPERQSIIAANNKRIEKDAVEGTHYGSVIRPFYYGNQYYIFVTETFRDIRLVGAPPQSIGNFGGDEDNWIWPRHNADFSLFRIYADANNVPADYSTENVPFKPRYFFPVSMKGMKEGDFTMVYGFPGRTTEYVSSYAVDLVQNTMDPNRVAIRDVRLQIWWDEMMKNDTVRIKYASKYYGLSNAWKKWKGEMHGLEKLDAIEKKQQYEMEFTHGLESKAEWKNNYENLLSDLKNYYDSLQQIQPLVDYYSEALLTPEIWKAAGLLRPLLDSILRKKSVDESLSAQIEKTKNQLKSFYKDYDAGADQIMLAEMIRIFNSHIESSNAPSLLQSWITRYKNNYAELSEAIFVKSILDNPEKIYELFENLNSSTAKKTIKDPAYELAIALSDFYQTNILPSYQFLAEQINVLNRQYMQAQLEVFSEKKFYPDANSTLRIAYGKVEGYDPKNAIHFQYFTTLDGVMEKFEPGHEFYDAPPKLLELYSQKDYGAYADVDGSLHTCFIASNHTTGGNSGSPVLNADGYLIGTNFDRCWEGTMSDLMFDPDQCRNISVDIRYTLFIIDKFAGAGYLLNEMELVN